MIRIATTQILSQAMEIIGYMTSKSFRLMSIAVCTAFVLFAASCAQPAVSGMTEGRTRSLIGTVAGLISLVVGVVALLRSTGRMGNGTGSVASIVALVLGLTAMILSVIHLANFTGGFGTGGGRAGAIIGLVLGLIGTILAALVLIRSRRSHIAD